MNPDAYWYDISVYKPIRIISPPPCSRAKGECVIHPRPSPYNTYYKPTPSSSDSLKGTRVVLTTQIEVFDLFCDVNLIGIRLLHDKDPRNVFTRAELESEGKGELFVFAGLLCPTVTDNIEGVCGGLVFSLKGRERRYKPGFFQLLVNWSLAFAVSRSVGAPPTSPTTIFFLQRFR